MSKTAVVTGGAKGIGKQVCRQLHSHGVTVIIVDVLVEEGQALANELQGSIFKRMDVSKIEEWRELVKEIPKIDFLFLNAAIMATPDIAAFWEQQKLPNLIDAMQVVQRVMEVNFFQMVYGVGTVSQIMQQGAKIMVTSSLAGFIVWPIDPIYVATKHAIIGYMRSIQKHLNDLNIKSYVACPGIVDTDLLGADRKSFPFQLMDPKFVAEKMVDLVLSDKPSQIVTIMPGRDPIVQQQKQFVKLFEQYEVEEKLKPED